MTIYLLPDRIREEKHITYKRLLKLPMGAVLTFNTRSWAYFLIKIESLFLGDNGFLLKGFYCGQITYGNDLIPHDSQLTAGSIWTEALKTCYLYNFSNDPVNEKLLEIAKDLNVNMLYPERPKTEKFVIECEKRLRYHTFQDKILTPIAEKVKESLELSENNSKYLIKISLSPLEKMKVSVIVRELKEKLHINGVVVRKDELIKI